MPQTKTSNSSRSGSSKRSTSSSKRGSSTSSRKPASRSSSTSRSSSPKSSSSSKNGKSRSPAATIAAKAKGPALAGGAALIGLAAGAALTRSRNSRGVLSHLPKPKLSKVSAPNVTLPKPGPALKSIGQAAGTVAERSRRLGELASEVQKASEAMESRSKGR